MADTDIQLPNAFALHVQERARNWQAYDTNQSNKTKLDELSRQFQGVSPDTVPTPVSQEHTPPAEITAVIATLESIIGQIASANQSILDDEAEISRMQAAQRNLIIAAVIIGIVLLFILYKVVLHH